MTSPPDLATRTSIVVVTRGNDDSGWQDSSPAVIATVQSLRATSRHRDLEFIVVHDTDVPFFTLLGLSEQSDVDVLLVPFAPEGGLAARYNRGAAHASGDVLMFVDDRIVARSDETIGHLIAPLSDPSIGMTGPKLLLADDRIEHAGISIVEGRVTHPHRLEHITPEKHPALFVDRDVNALSSAAAAVRSADFRAVGGWSLEAPERTRGVDLSFKLRREGLRPRWMSSVHMTHHVNADPLPELTRWEQDFLVRRWGRRLRPGPPATREGGTARPANDDLQ